MFRNMKCWEDLKSDMNGSEAACHGLTVFGKEIIWCYLFTEDNENCLLKIFGGSDTFRSQIATVKHSSLATDRRVSNNSYS